MVFAFRLYLPEALDMILLYLVGIQAAPLDVAIVLPDGFLAVVAQSDFVV